MVRVYMINVRDQLPEESLKKLYRLQSVKKIVKEKSFCYMENVLQTLYGNILIRYLCQTRFRIENNKIHFSKNEYGKPYIINLPIYFNISHAGEWVVCAIDEGSEVGVDIEKIKKIDLNIAQRFFCKCEYELMYLMPEKERLDYFYSIWTLKESYLKWLGTGLCTSLNSFFFLFNNNEIEVVDCFRNNKVSFRQYPLEGYKLSVCSNSNNFIEKIELIHIDDIIDELL